MSNSTTFIEGYLKIKKKNSNLFKTRYLKLNIQEHSLEYKHNIDSKDTTKIYNNNDILSFEDAIVITDLKL